MRLRPGRADPQSIGHFPRSKFALRAFAEQKKDLQLNDRFDLVGNQSPDMIRNACLCQNASSSIPRKTFCCEPSEHDIWEQISPSRSESKVHPHFLQIHNSSPIFEPRMHLLALVR